MSEVETDAGQGSWRVVLTGWRQEGGGKIHIEKAPAVVMNYGNKMQFVFFSQEIPGHLYERVDKRLEKIKNDITKEYKDVSVEFGRNENQMMFAAEYVYDKFLYDYGENMHKEIAKIVGKFD